MGISMLESIHVREGKEAGWVEEKLCSQKMTKRSPRVSNLAQFT
jgi:hypothetical protein